MPLAKETASRLVERFQRYKPLKTDAMGRTHTQIFPLHHGRTRIARFARSLVNNLYILYFIKDLIYFIRDAYLLYFIGIIVWIRKKLS